MYVPAKTATLFVAALLTLSCTFAQSKQEVFAALQQIVNRAVGEKIDGNSLFSKEPDKITKQIFTEAAVAVYTKNTEKKSTEWIHRYSNISWGDIFDHDVFTEYKNNDLQIVKIRFKKYFKREFFPSDETSDDDPSTSDYFEFYIRTKDKAEFEKNMTLLYSFKPQNTESAYNAQIRRFTKDQTIQWLKTKLEEYMYAGQYGSNIKIVTLNSCSLVVTYKGLVRSYEETLPTAIKAINKYGKFEYESNSAAIRTTTPDLLDDGKKRYGKYSSDIVISTKDEEVMDNIQCAFKHLATFCNGTATTTTKPITSPSVSAGISGSSGTSSMSGSSGTSASSSSYATKDESAEDQWYLCFSKGKNMGLQKWVTSETDFPTQKIDDNWKQDYYITDVAYAGTERKWFLAFSKTTAYTDQVWRKRDTRKEIMESIDDIWKSNKDLHITNLVYANNAWVVVATKGTVAKDQIYMYENSFPEEKIKTYWGKGYDITDMVYSRDGWLIIMTQGYNYTQRYKKLETSNPWNHQLIIDYKNEGYYLSQVCKAGATWYMLFNKDAKVTTAEYQSTDQFNPRSIDEMWKQSFSIDKLIYVPAR